MTTARATFAVLAAIDLRAGRVVRLRQGDFDRQTAYDARPEILAATFAAAGAHWLHVVDLDGARTGIPAHIGEIAGIVTAVRERARVEVAGGLRDERSVDEALAAGATRVVVGTQALRDPAFAGRLIEVHGAGRVAVAIDVRNGRAVGHGWASDDPGIDAAEAIRRLADEGVGTFEVTAIDRDGLLEGPNLALYDRVVRLDRGSVIASGGIATLDDLRAVRAAGCTGAIVGRALYEGQLDLHEVMALAREPE